MHAFHPRLNYPNRIRTSTPGGGCHGYRAPRFCLFLPHASETLRIRRCKFFRGVQWNIALQRRDAAARRHGYPTGGDCADPEPPPPHTPFANLGWRQQRALADLNQSFKVSTPPIFCSCKDIRHPSPDNCISSLTSWPFF